jgi:tRNA uridine 5-carboxymethylaminomethyl modification enzyme
VAGINAVASLRGIRPLGLGRHQAYTGVLIDDLVTKEIDEPYRMFTSRAEHRLLLRQDNADERLLKFAVRYGLLPRENWERMIQRRRRISGAHRQLAAQMVPAGRCNGILRAVGEREVSEPQRASQLLQRPRIELCALEKVLPEGTLRLSEREKGSLEIRVKYEGYIRRQSKLAERFLQREHTRIPPGFTYDIEALSTESREKLKTFRPLTLGQASRISGVRNSDLSVLMIYIDRFQKGRKDEERKRPEKQPE